MRTEWTTRLRDLWGGSVARLRLPGGWVQVCYDCAKFHKVERRHTEAVRDWEAKHPGHATACYPGAALGLYLFDHGLTWRENADVKIAWGTSTAMTCTLASLAQAAAREATAIDNTTNLYLDAMIYVACKLQAGSPASDKSINLYGYGSEDGSNYTDNATGTNAAITMRVPSNLQGVGVIQTPDSGALTYKSHPFLMSGVFGARMPRKWGIVVENRTNITFDTTEGNHTKSYTGVYYTTA